MKIAAWFAALCAVLAAPALAQPAFQRVAMPDRFEGRPRDDGRPARRAGDLSGIACRPLDAGSWRCLLIDDEARAAQWATLRDRRLLPGATLPLIGQREPRGPEAVGSATAIGRCPGGVVDEFLEFDGEGVAWRPGPGPGGTFFVIGSHACGRDLERGLRMRFSNQLLARIEADTARVALSWRLGPSLRAVPALAPHVHQALTEEAQGLDIEGIAAIGDALFFGLRAPSLRGEGFILRGEAAALFDPAPAAGAPVPLRLARLALGANTGIRDMAALPDGRLLLLTGPAQDQADVPFGLHLTTPSDAPAWPLAPLLSPIAPPEPGAKAEGVAVLGVRAGLLRLLLLYEDPRQGGAFEITLPLPPRG